jgi:60kDa lysophospholipase
MCGIGYAKQRMENVQDIKIQKKEVKVLILYTGGTFGMAHTNDGYQPKPNWLLNKLHSNLNFYDDEYSRKHFEEGTSVTPETFMGHRMRYRFEEFEELIDSSELNRKHVIQIVEAIENNYDLYDSFIIIYGTDTMAYMSSYLSFCLENLNKTVVMTGSQIPISEWRNDADANLVGALTVCEHIIPEVVMFFNSKLFRGNRVIKQSSTKLDAFDSPNFPPLAKFDVFLDFEKHLIMDPPEDSKKFNVFKDLEGAISLVFIHPLITRDIFLSSFKRAKAIILQCYGMGNFPMGRKDLLKVIEDALTKYK